MPAIIIILISVYARKKQEREKKELFRKVYRISLFFQKEPSTSTAGLQPDEDNENIPSISSVAVMSDAEKQEEASALNEELFQAFSESTRTVDPVEHPTDIGL